jgi:hypothetical protein
MKTMAKIMAKSENGSMAGGEIGWRKRKLNGETGEIEEIS